MPETNPYCEALGIQVPRLETAAESPDANWFSLLIAALLERGGPITLDEAAERFEEAGIAPADRALGSLKRCRPARPPIYRDGDRYALDPYDDESDLWAFRLGLQPPKVPAGSISRSDPAVIQAAIERANREREAHAERLAALRRVLVHAFPPRRPRAVVLLDVNRREIATLTGDQLAQIGERLAGCDVIAALEVRALLRTLGFDPGSRRLAELGPPRKTRRLNRRGRTLKITTEMLVRGSCSISRPFGDPRRLEKYLEDGQLVRFRRRLESDAKSLFALYQYGRLHGAVRLRWGFLDEMIPAPWIHRDEETLGTLMSRALERGVPLEVVTGSAPGWKDPWARARKAAVVKSDHSWRSWLVDEGGCPVREEDVQLARLAGQDDR